MGLFGRILPPIMVGEADRHDLLVLAMSGVSHSADQADDLLYELGRAAVVDDQNLPLGVVKMGSWVTARVNGGEPVAMRLSFPREQGPGSVSIFSPTGTALLGLHSGQSMKWTDRQGKKHALQILSVNNQAV